METLICAPVQPVDLVPFARGGGLKRAHGRVACLPSNCTQTGNKVAAVYDHAGHVTQLTYPDGRVVKSTLSQGFLQSVTYDN